MFQSSESTEIKSSAKPMMPSVFTVALLVKVVRAAEIAAPAPIPSCAFT